MIEGNTILIPIIKYILTKNIDFITAYEALVITGDALQIFKLRQLYRKVRKLNVKIRRLPIIPLKR